MFTILDYSSALEYSIIRRYTNIVYYIIKILYIILYDCMYDFDTFLLMCVDVMVMSSADEVSCSGAGDGGRSDVYMLKIVGDRRCLEGRPFQIGVVLMCAFM